MTDIITQTLQAFQAAENEKRAYASVLARQEAWVLHLDSQNREHAQYIYPIYDVATPRLENVAKVEETAISRSIMYYVANATLSRLKEYSALPPIAEITAIFTDFQDEPEPGPAGDFARWFQGMVLRAYNDQTRLLEEAYLNAGAAA